MEKSAAAYKSLSSFEASIKTTMETEKEDGSKSYSQSYSGTVSWRRPNIFAIRLADSKQFVHIVSDGRTMSTWSSQNKKRHEQEQAPLKIGGSDEILDAQVRNDIIFFLSGLEILERGHLASPKVARSKEFQVVVKMGAPSFISSVEVDTVCVSRTIPASGKYKAWYMEESYLIGRHDHILRQYKTSSRGGAIKKPYSITETYWNVRANPALPASRFQLKPTAGVTRVNVEDLEEPEEPPTISPRLKVGAAPFAFATKDLAGKPLNLEQYKGKVVLLDFWATWCPPCRDEVPNMVANYAKYHAKGFEVVAISLDEDRKALESYIAENKMPWRQGFDGLAWKGSVAKLYDVKGIPSTILIGRDGKVASLEVRGTTLEPAIQAALAKK